MDQVNESERRDEELGDLFADCSDFDVNFFL